MPRVLHIKSHINYNTNQQYHHYLNISLLVTIGIFLSPTVFASIGAVEITTKKIDTKAWDILLQPSLEQTQSEKSNNLLSSSSTTTITTAATNSPTASNFKTATKYEFVKKWGSKGTGDGQFQRPHDLDFDPTEKYLYTVDRDGNRIQVFDKDGNFIKKWGSQGTENGQFTIPYGVDVDSKGDVWVADRGNDRVQKFDKDGNFLFKFGSSGSKEGQLN